MIREISEIDGQRLRADVCIIGSGAAGLTLAAELLDSGQRVVVLAGGPEHISDEAQALYAADSIGLSMDGAELLRFRSFGGSTRRWAGQLLPFVEEDFELREWVPHSGWPLPLATLGPYYTRATRALGVPDFPEGGRPQWPAELPSADALRGGSLEPYCSVFMRDPDMARLHGPALARSSTTDVLLDASATQLLADASGAIERVRVGSPRGATGFVEADTVALCAGGLESARILLDSEVGVGGNTLGRFFQEHSGFAVPFSACDTRRLSALLGLCRWGGVSRQPYLRASPALQRARRLPGANASIRFIQPSALHAGKELFRALRDPSRRADAPRNLRLFMRQPGPAVRAATRLLRGGSAQDASGIPMLTLGVEQVPNPDSRVFLSDKRDSLGVRRLVVDWRVTELDTVALRTWLEILAEELDRAGLATVDLDAAPSLKDPMALSGTLVDAGHHMGTTRMAADEREGVVDPDCRVFGAENLFVVSSSVFPTSGTSNPTLTIIALALRLADRLRATAS